ncbi:MAG: glycerol-3-phosphate dehydrogenase [Rhodospirillales bacterium]|nr:glycerol-3-phosphate dehydrogenase [Rhodospirillales bacterium]
MSAEHNPPYDLVVIGGGINGAAIACDAAGRGLSVALAEMRDFSEGTSSRSSKLIHGGLRYLETYDFKLVRDALLEREILMAKVPHLVWPLRLVLPHVPGLRPRWMIRLGLFLYDHLARRKQLPASESVDFRKHPAGGALKPEFRHGFAYSDCRGDDSRLVIANLLGAQHHGAHVLTRHRFVSARREGRIWDVVLENCLTEQPVRLRARALVNAAGPWVTGVGKEIHGTTTSCRLRLVRGSHIVVPRHWEGEYGYFLQTRDGRLMEAFPYEEEFTSIGTTDEPWDDAPENVRISDKEIDYMIGEVNRFLRRPVRREEIVWSYSGVRPLFEVGGTRDSDLSTLTRDYSFEIDHLDGEAPVLTIFGGKLTTHRKLAADAMQRLSAFLRPARAGRRAEEPLPGGDFGPGGIEAFETALKREHDWLPDAMARRYVRTYGTRTRELLVGVQGLNDLGRHFGADLYQREVDFLVATEWARSAEDILWRRTKLGLSLSPAEAESLQSYLRLRSSSEGLRRAL